MKIFKTIVILLIGIFTVMFFIENMDSVPIHFPILKGHKVGLIFIMLGSYFMGMLTMFGIINGVGAKIRKKRRIEESNEDQKELFEE